MGFMLKKKRLASRIHAESAINADRGGIHRAPDRFRWLAAWCLASLLLAALSFAAGALIRSPWEDAVKNSKAQPTAIAAVGEREFVGATASVAGTVSLGDLLAVEVPRTEAARAVVTSVGVRPGDEVVYGRPLTSVSGRPLLALSLEIPLYRDLTPGMQGPDVESLQECLRRLGYYAAEVDGRYGASTGAAVEALYAGSGFNAPLLAGVTSDASTGVPVQGNNSRSILQGEAGSILEGLPGTFLPMEEVIDVPPGRARVISIAKLGSVLSPQDQLASVRFGRSHVLARVGSADAEQFEMDREVTISIAGGGRIDGIVRSVSDFRTGESDGTVPGYDIRVEVPQDLMRDLPDASVAVVEPVPDEEGMVSLAIPLTALREDSNGYFVLLADGGERVPVVVGLQDAGFVQVLEGKTLKLGSKVLIGGPDAP